MSIPLQTLQTLFTLGDVTLFVWANEPGWPVTYVSPNVERLLGISAADLLSRRVLFGDLIAAEDLAPLQASVARSVASGADLCMHDDYRLRRPDGRWIWVHDVTVIQRAADGSVISFAGHLLDVTQSREDRAALMAQRDRFELVLQGTRLGLWDWNPTTNAVVFDERWARMLGHELAEIEPSLESWQSRVHPDDLAGCFADIQAHLEGKTEFYENVHRMRHKDGRWIYILDRGRVCERDAEGRATRFTGTHTDITPQKLAELAARQANLAKDQFLARMSHEIRTPLNGVLGLLQLLESSALDGQQTAYIEAMRESGETLLTVINDILDASKIEAGQMRIDPHPFDVPRLLQTVFDLYRERAHSKQLGYRLLLDNELPKRLVGDSHRLRQVLTNLLSNALKFTARGKVELIASAQQRPDGAIDLRLEVSDTGCGIADTAAIWEPFRQGDASTSRHHGGTGLGLSICRQLITLMGGTLELQSQPGVGSTFTAQVPLRAAADAASSPAPTQLASIDAARSLAVLVAEDNPVNQMLMRGVLEKLGLRGTFVGNGADAIERCKQQPFDLVLMDLHMPVVDGLTACRSIRKELPPTEQPRIIAISADAFAPTEAGFQDAGFDGALAKPFRLAQLAQLIRETPAR